MIDWFTIQSMTKLRIIKKSYRVYGNFLILTVYEFLKITIDWECLKFILPNTILEQFIGWKEEYE
jgi:hypothetical protein